MNIQDRLDVPVNANNLRTMGNNKDRSACANAHDDLSLEDIHIHSL